MFTLARYSCALSVALSIGIVGAVIPLSAEAATFNSYDNGWYRSDGYHDPTNDNIYTGLTFSFGFHTFFAFDLSGAAGQTAVSAQLVIPANGYYYSSSGGSTYEVFDYIGSIPNLLDGTAGIAGFNDLRSGNSYGQTTISGVSTTDPMPEVAVTLNAAALADINALLAGSAFDFAIGGACTSCTVGSVLWSSSEGVNAGQLILEFGTPSAVPLPGALPLFASGLVGGFGYLRWRSRKRRAIPAV